MGKAKVRVLYPTAFAALGLEVAGGDEVSIDEEEASQLVAVGYAEPVKAKAEKAEKS